MGKPRAKWSDKDKHPFEDNPFIVGFIDWMGSPEGQDSIEALDLVFGALDHVASTPGGARSSGPTGNGYRSSSRRRVSMPSIRIYPAI